MKKLLGIIVLGLLLSGSANASSVKYSYDKDFVCFQIINETVFVGSSKGGWATQTDRIESICSIFVYKDYHPKEYSKITNYWPHLRESKDYFFKNAVHDYFIKSLKLNKKKFSKILHKKTKINLAKNEENLIIFKSSFVNRKNKNQYWGYSDINEKISKRLALYKCEKSITNNETDCILNSSYSIYIRTNDKEHIAKVRADKNLLAKISSKDQNEKQVIAEDKKKREEEERRIADVKKSVKKVEVAETIKVGDIPSINIFDTNNYKHRIFFELENKTYNAFTLKNEIRNELHLWFNEYEDGIIGNYNYEMIMSINSPVIVFSKTNKLGEHLKIVHWNNHKTELGNNLGNLYKTITYESKNEDFTYYQYIDKNHQITYGVYNKIKKKWDAHTSLGQDWLLKKGLLTETGKTPDEQLELIKKAQLITKGYKETEQKTIKLKNKFLGQINLKKPNFINSFTPTNIAGINILDNIKFYLKKENLNEDVHVKNRNENNKKKTIYSNMINNGSKKIIDINIENNYFDNLYVKVDKNQIINNISFYKYLGTNKVYPDEEFCISERDNFINNLNIKNVNFNYDYLYDEMDNNKIYQDIKYNDFEYKNKKLRFEIACFNTINNEDSKRNKDIMYILGISLSNIEELNDVYIEQEVKRISRFTIEDINNNNYKIIDQIALTELQDEITISKKLEEFKPENKDVDNQAPVIKIAKSFKVNETSYVIEGEVTDQSDRIFIEVEGKTIQAKNGKFKINRFSPIDEEFNIVAIDQWGNRSEPQLVQITVDTSVSLVADKVEPLNPTKIRSKPDRNKIALIIGIEKYEQTPNASFANLDAKYFYEYARNSFGVLKNNIKILVDEDANLIQSLGTLNKWLPGKVKSNQTEVIIFFAGHGLASNNGEELFLLPQDSDPDLLERTALSRNELFESLLKLNPKSVTMFFDTCFSGISRDEKTLLASARPIRITANEQDDVPNNFTIFSASQLDQISSGLKEAKHGIFSYYLMKGLEGDADLNKDRTITNGELLAYMDDNVSQKASELGRQQNPSLVGNPEQILARY